jgi:hypothetical protein
MINPEAVSVHRLVKKSGFATLDGGRALDHGRSHERSPRHRLYLPRDYKLAIRWLRPSFLNRDSQDARPTGRDFFRLHAKLGMRGVMAEAARDIVTARSQHG